MITMMPGRVFEEEVREDQEREEGHGMERRRRLGLHTQEEVRGSRPGLGREGRWGDPKEDTDGEGATRRRWRGVITTGTATGGP